ncbi:MAG: SRPBCC family protein [Chloroflexota bacterium]|nr:SRPBCC family protein [Chloroflexota bacterium]
MTAREDAAGSGPSLTRRVATRLLARPSRLYELTDQFVVAASAAETWRFFSAAENLPLITPPWLAFQTTMPEPIVIERDTLLEYTITWLGAPVRWRTRIIDFTPPRQFIDLQIHGPYALWHHQHTFEPVPGGVLCQDRVLYQLPFGPLGRLTHALVVRRQLLAIFRYRRQVIARELGWVRAAQDDVEIRAFR